MSTHPKPSQEAAQSEPFEKPLKANESPANAPTAEPKTPQTAVDQEPVSENGDDFWQSSSKKSFAEHYSEEERNAMIEAIDATLTDMKEKEVVAGTITRFTDKYVIVSLNHKSDGLIHRAEFRDMKEEPKIGESVEVFVESQEDKKGNLVVSRRKALVVRAWERIQSAHDEDTIVDCRVKRRTKGGLIVDIFGIEAFLPGSQVDVKPVKDFDAYIDRVIEVKVVKINYSNDNVVVSHKMLIEKSIEKQRVDILQHLEKGQVLEGTVKNLTNFGAFIDLGGFDGLLHITDIAWGRINSPKDVLEVDQKIHVVVLSFDEKKKRISLGLKQLQEHPWAVTKDYTVGTKVKGKIVNLTDYGAFLEIVKGVEGLLHVSEMSWSQHLRSPKEFVSVGDEVEAVILSIDHEEHRMALGLKQLRENPWKRQDLLVKYAPGTKHTGLVRNLTNYGIFIELEEGIDGLVHVSDLSWTKKIRHPSDFTETNKELAVVVLEIDQENERLSLSHRHLEEDPWGEFENMFARGTTHECTVLRRNEKVAFLELPYGIDGIAYLNNLQKEDQTLAEDKETLLFVVLDFSRNDKRILLSHTHTFKEVASHHEGKEGKTSSQVVQKTVREVNRNTEKSTLGDLDSMSSLKQKISAKKKRTDDKDASEASE